MQINVFLPGNLQVLTESKTPVAQWLAGCNPDPETVFNRVFVNTSGLLDWRMDDGFGLFEKAPPQLFYGDWRPKDHLEGGATVIVGTALGYGLNHVLTGTPNSHKVFVVEPRPEMLLACLGQTDYRPFLAAGKLRFLPPIPAVIEESVKELDVSFLFSRIHLRSDLPSKQIGPEYVRVTTLVREKLENFSVELSTLRFKQEVMVGNELKNFKQAMNDGSLLRAKGMAKGVTAAILGAGPSLAELIPQLAQHRGTALYATAMQTLPALERLQFKPDLCLALDFREDLVACVKNLKDPAFAADIPLIYSTKIDPGVLAVYPGPKIPLWTMGGVGTFMLADQELVLDAGGNVGVTLVRFLTWCGVERFLLIGQDFAWSGDKSHVAGHHAANNTYVFTPGQDVKLKNASGQDIYTNLGYLSAKRDLEKDLGTANIPFFNLYGGGAVIAGAKHVTVEDVIRDRINDSAPGASAFFLEALARARTPRVRPIYTPRAAQWANSLKHAGKRLEKLLRKADKRQTEMRELFHQIHFFLKQDPLYLPYLYNEVMDMAGLIHTRPTLGHKEVSEFKAIRKRVLDKVKEVDERLGPSRAWAA